MRTALFVLTIVSITTLIGCGKEANITGGKDLPKSEIVVAQPPVNNQVTPPAPPFTVTNKKEGKGEQGRTKIGAEEGKGS